MISRVSSAIRVLTGAVGVAMSITVIRLPITAILGGLSTMSASMGIVYSSVNKKYQKSCRKIRKCRLPSARVWYYSSKA